MWKCTALFSGGVMALFLSGTALAHVGLELDLPQVPNPAAIKIDGVENDWAWIDPSFAMMTQDQQQDGDKALPTREDLDFTYFFAYSAPPENMLYYFMRVQDNYLRVLEVNPSRYWVDDSLQLVIDADHSGAGSFLGNNLDEVATGQRYHIRVLPVPGQPAAWNDQVQRVDIPALGWSSDIYQGAPTQWFELAWTLSPAGAGQGSTNVTYTYEFRLALWDIYGQSPEESVRHIFEPGQVLHLGMSVFDDDDDEQGMTNRLVPIGGAQRQDQLADQMVDYFALEAGEGSILTAVENESWGRIKSHLDRLR